LFYLMLRTVRRHGTSLDRGSQPWKAALAKECARLDWSLGRLIDVRKRERANAVHPRGNIAVICADYSDGVCPAREAMERIIGDVGGRRTLIRDVRSLEPRSFDVVVTDPPYGFNARVSTVPLAQLYADCIPVLLNALKAHGQLVLAVPDWSHTGQWFPYFTQKEMITQQVLVAAETLGRRIIQQAHAVPAPGPLFRAPYFWESERALRRAILHFTVED
jgi:hypothetical protein